VALDPHNSTCYQRRYQFYYWNLDYTHALDNINIQLEGQPDDVLLYIYRSELYLLLNDARRAEADARHAVTLGSGYALPYIALTQALSVQQRYADALAEAERAVSAGDPDNHVAALAARGWVHLRMGQVVQAAADFDEALKGERLDRLARFGRAAISIRNGQYESALSDIEAGISQYGGYGLGYVLRAQVNLARNEPDKARADLQAARQRILYPDEVSQADALLAGIE
jgi:Tfp pilus assembly protein PilF